MKGIIIATIVLLKIFGTLVSFHELQNNIFISQLKKMSYISNTFTFSYCSPKMYHPVLLMNVKTIVEVVVLTAVLLKSMVKQHITVSVEMPNHQ